ncbi:MAG: hypothetical protein JWM09_34 [Francisellaceae bacterium]|nr:hypothetical protein [Francisellaceae bacterium]
MNQQNNCQEKHIPELLTASYNNCKSIQERVPHLNFMYQKYDCLDSIQKVLKDYLYCHQNKEFDKIAQKISPK